MNLTEEQQKNQEEKERLLQELDEMVTARHQRISEELERRMNEKIAACPDIDIEAAETNELIKILFEENEDRMFYILQAYARYLSLSDLKNIRLFLEGKKADEKIISDVNDSVSNFNTLRSALFELAEAHKNKISEELLNELTADALADLNRKSMFSLNERLNTLLKEYQEHTETILKQYLQDKLKEENVTAEILDAFSSALMETEIETDEEPPAIYAALHYLEKDQSGNLTPEAIKAAEIFSTAYKKAVKQLKSPKPAQFIETITKQADKYYFPNDKIANKLSALTIDGIKRELSEEKRGTKKQVTSYISFDFDEAAKETDLAEFTLTFSEFDKQVQEAVVSLMKAGNTVLTPFMIFKTLTGNSGNKISDKWENDIKRSMRKFNSVFVTADLTDTAKLYPELRKIEKIIKQTRLLQYEITYIKTKNGSNVLAYEMLKEPILYTIANAKKQVGTLDIKLLENAKTTNTTDSTELKIYMLKRIDSMKHGKTPSILFETLYKAINRETTREKRTTRTNAEKLLMQFKADKIIKDFEFEIKGRQPFKINITL